jgi:hypothetical protein
MTDTRVQFFDAPHVMQPGSVAEYLRDFASDLAAQGYQSLSISNYLWPALHFGAWIDANRIPLTAFTNETLIGFRDHYCRCPGRRKIKRVSRPYAARTRYFIEYLRGRNLIKTESLPLEPIPSCIVDFRGMPEHMRRKLSIIAGTSLRQTNHRHYCRTPIPGWRR